MIVFSGLARVFRIMSAHAPACCDPAEIYREVVQHCDEFGVGVDLRFRDVIIEARPGSDPVLLAAPFVDSDRTITRR